MPQPSLQRQLLAWVLGALAAVWSVFMVIGYLTGVHEADELTDGHLASVASLLLAQPDPRFAERLHAAELGVAPHLRAHDYQQSLSVIVWDAQGRVMARTGPAPQAPSGLAEGFQTLALGTPPSDWRVFARHSDVGQPKKIAILLSMQERRALEADIALHVAAPGLWLLPVVALVLTLVIRRGLRPLNDLSARVRELDVHHAGPLHAPPHAEFQAMVSAIETLSGRYRTALARERELADAFAHELRTPLASVALHTSSLRGALTLPERERALLHLEQETARTTAIIHDLLALARTSRMELAETAETVDLVHLVKEAVNAYVQPAYESGHALSVNVPEHLHVQGHAVLLEIALRNLIANALGHTPPGTQIDIGLTRSPVALHVRDNGSLVGQTGRSACAARTDSSQSAWVVGLGLGHQVVQRIAAVHGGTFRAAPVDADGWRCYTLELGPG